LRKSYYGEKYGKLTIIDERELLSAEKALCKCECGNEKYISVNKVVHGETKSCGCLRFEGTKNSDKRVKDIVGQTFGRLTVISLLPKIEGKGRKWLCLCSCGNYTKVETCSLSGGKTRSCGCLSKEVAYKRSFIDLTGKTFGKWTVKSLSGKNIHNGAVWKCVCECGKEKDVSSNCLIQGHSRSCGCERRGKTIPNARIDISGKKYGRLTVLFLLNPESCDYPKVWRCLCDCGNICDIPYGSLTTGCSTSCGCFFKEQLSKRSVKDITGQKFGKLTVIERFGSKNRRATWLCKCDCGNEFVALGKDLRQNKTISCGCSSSKMEVECARLLKLNKINFTKQKRFNDCKDKRRLPFDIYIEDSNICIELDGIQHFEPICGLGGMKNFLITKRHDAIKNKYCLDNDIFLLRIPYTQSDNIEQILFENNIIKEIGEQRCKKE